METETKTKVEEMVMIAECEKGPINEPIEFESFEEFEALFGRYDSAALLGVPEGLGEKFLTYIRTKLPNPLSDIVERIQLRTEIESMIEDFLDDEVKYNAEELMKITDRLTKLIKEYTRDDK